MFSTRMLRHLSSVDCELPYNWNWQRRWSEADVFLGDHAITLLDIGARGDAPPELESIRHHVRRVGFEADATECRRLNETGAGTFFPELLGGSAGEQTLHIYRDPGYSSTFSLAARYQRLWSGDVPVDREITLSTVTLDDFMARHSDLAPDIIKVDTQGSELSILRGAEDTLSRVGLVEVEVEFSEIYEGQPLFGDVASYLHDQGFELLYLNRALISRSRVYKGPSRGQLLFADALFAKRDDRLQDFTEVQLAKFVVLLCQYGHRDIAASLLRERPTLQQLLPGLQAVLDHTPSRVRRLVLMQVDKLLALALHLRGYNQRATDSDRAWPIR